MIDQLLDVFTKLSSYAMVIFFALFAYSKVTKKTQKYAYGKYAIISLVLMIVFGTLFFNSPKGQTVLKRGAEKQSEQTLSSHDHTVATKAAIQKTVKSTTLLFPHQLTLTEHHGLLDIQIRDKKDSLNSFKLTTIAILKAIKHSDYQKYQKFKIHFQRSANSGVRPTLSVTIRKATITKTNLDQLRMSDLKRISEDYYESY